MIPAYTKQVPFGGGWVPGCFTATISQGRLRPMPSDGSARNLHKDEDDGDDHYKGWPQAFSCNP